MTTQILMPALSPTMEEGKLARWLVKEGDKVRSGDVLAEIETDKATMEIEAVDEGRLAKILVREGSEGVKVNQPIALLIGEGEEAGGDVDISSAMKSIKDAVAGQSGPQAPVDRKSEPQANAPAHAETAASATTRSAAEHMNNIHAEDAGERGFASPLARRMASLAGIDIAKLSGTGPRGRVVKADIEAEQERSGAGKAPAQLGQRQAPVQTPTVIAPAGFPGVAPLADARLFFKADEYDEIPHDSIRKAIARRMSSSAALIPHFYLTVDCRIDELLRARTHLNERAPKGQGTYKLSVNDFVVKAAALALMRVPEVNASWTDGAILRHRHADIGVAVALDFGLITPIVFRAEKKGLAEISTEVKALAEKARARKLKPHDYEGGGFAISNLGMYGIKHFTAVINPPHAAILAVGAGTERAVANSGKIEAATVMTVTMSCDHRVIDGATGARYLQSFRQFVEDPAAMLI